MRVFKFILPGLLLVAGLAGPAQAGMITTTFGSNNGGAVGGAFYFDINVLNPGGITVESISLNTSTNLAPINLAVFTRPGTAAGNETSIFGWTLTTTGTGLGLGSDVASLVDVADFYLAPGLTGIALHAVDFDHDYTNGNGSTTFGSGSNQFYSNSDVELLFGSATNVEFTGNVFRPRVANLTIEYSAGAAVPTTTTPEPSSMALLGLGVFGLAAGRYRRRRNGEAGDDAPAESADLS